MNNKEMLNSGELITPQEGQLLCEPISLHMPKKVAEIRLCGSVIFNIVESSDWIPPLPEQIKNLKEVFNIDVILL